VVDIETTELLILALGEEWGKPDPIPFAPRDFADAAYKLGSEGNQFAARFKTYPSVSGRYCPDFSQGLNLAASLGLLNYFASFEYFVIAKRRIPPSIAQSSSKPEALLLAKAYLRAAT